jgi:hypothetical protein
MAFGGRVIREAEETVARAEAGGPRRLRERADRLLTEQLATDGKSHDEAETENPRDKGFVTITATHIQFLATRIQFQTTHIR